MKNASILYFSASGNTSKIARWIGDELAEKGFKIHSFKIPEILNSVPDELKNSDIIIIGSPTYMWHTPPIVKKFLESLKDLDNKPVGIFVTFGSVTAGSNLSFISKIIRKKNGRIVGAMQLEAEHSMMFKSDSPLAKGKPFDDDVSCVKEFVSLCLKRASSSKGEIKKIPSTMKHFAFMAPPGIGIRLMPQLKFKNEICTLCGKCIEQCPTENIMIKDNTVIHGNNCLLCYNCVRTCPRGAVDANLSSMEIPLRVMSHLPEKNKAVY